MQEVKRVGDGAADKMPWLSKALQEGTFQLVYDGLQKSVQVRMPHAAFGNQSRCACHTLRSMQALPKYSPF